jgi:hypothetical protein
MNATMDTPLWQLTAREFIALMQQISPAAETKPAPGTPEYVYGIAGIAELLGCSKVQVHEYRKQGWLEPAIRQYGRKVICDARLAMELFGKQYKK